MEEKTEIAVKDGSYTDDKGRRRWHRNDDVAERLKELHDLLVIGGYDASHAARYPKLAYLISRHAESIDDLHQEKRLRELPGVGATVETILIELLETGAATKTMTSGDGYEPPPRTVLELTALPGLGAKLAHRLYAELGVDSLKELQEALEAGALNDFAGIGPKLREQIRRGCEGG